MTSNYQPPQWQRTARLLAGVTLLASTLQAQQTTNRNQTPTPDARASGMESTAADDETITLTPFTVDASKDKGYYAENTLAGSRLKSNLSDLAASITVVTKQQMEDTASLDINDVFKFEANTEGSNTYTPVVTDRGTAKDTVSGYSFGNNGAFTNNAQSNRVRGLAAPDSAINYYPASARIPFDSYNTQSIEISRGPNSLLFGLGSPAGIVNQSTATAALNKNTNTVQLRTDQYGSYRGSIGINRSLIQDKLAIYVAALYNNQQFQRKPSVELTRRQYGAITYKPFKKTVLRGFAENYNNYSNRPNFLTPRDFVTPWLQAGRPSYDPTTLRVTRDSGQVTGPYLLDTRAPGYVPGTLATTGALNLTTSPQFVPGITFENGTRPLERIDGNNQADFFQRQPVLVVPSWTNPAQLAVNNPSNYGFTNQDPRYLTWSRQWTTSTANAPIPTVNGVPGTYGTWNFAGVTDRGIYDWKKYNINQQNFAKTRSGHYNVDIEQQILPNLFFNGGWFRQDIDSVENFTLSQLTGATLTVDTNVKLPDGSANPYYGLPFVSDGPGPDTFFQAETDDNFRAMLAYELDFTKHDNWVQWLGHHRFLALWSDQIVDGRIERWRNSISGGDTDAQLRYFPNPLLNNGWNLWNNPGQSIQRYFYLASPGDPQARVSHSSGFYGNKGWETPYNSSVRVYNWGTGQFQQDQITEQILFADNGSFRTYREVESLNLATQNYLFNERIVTTFGWRHDDYKARRTGTGVILDDNGATLAPSLTPQQIYDPVTGLVANPNFIMNRWLRWDRLDGNTTTVGLAVRPFKDISAIERRAGEGSFLADFVRSLTLYYNRSSNFNPPQIAQTDYFYKPLPKPSGKGKDIGLGWSMFNNKLVGRVSWFKTENSNERTSAAATLLTRLAYGDTSLMQRWAEAVVRLRANPNAYNTRNWNTDAVNPLSEAQIQQVWSMLQLPVNYYANAGSVAGTQQSEAKGYELQLTYNPLPNWTMKVTGSKQETVFNNIAPQYDDWLAVRLPVWTAATASDIPDFTDADGIQYHLSNFWQGYGYSGDVRINSAAGNTTSQNYFNNTVASQIGLAKAQEGAVAADQRKYHLSFLTNYAFTKGRLKGWSLGGSERWESKAVIGYFGKVGDPTQPTNINIADVTRPVYDDGNYYTDLWIAYRRKVFGDKIGLKVQLNVNNVTESGGLRPIAVNFDGTPWAYRIVDSRQFVLTTTFDF